MRFLKYIVEIKKIQINVHVISVVLHIDIRLTQ